MDRMTALVAPLSLFFVITLVVAPGCLPAPPEIEYVPRETYLCPEMCQHLLALGCPEGKPLKDGTSCTDWCELTENLGVPLGLRCILAAHDCVEVGACTRPRAFKGGEGKATP